MLHIFGAFAAGHLTQAADTPIVKLIPPLAGSKVRLNHLVYTAAGTVHDLLLMRTLGETTTSAAVAAAATTINLSAKSFVGQDIAANDYIVTENADGTFSAHLVTSVSTLAMTVAAVPKAINAAAPVYILGAPGDTTWHTVLKSIASTRQEFNAPISGLADGGYDDGTYDRDGRGDPMLVYSANATAAGILNWLSASYVR